MTNSTAAIEQPRDSQVALRHSDASEVAVIEPPRTEFDKILALAENPNIPIERISQVIDLFQKVERERARRAFESALAAAKGEFGPIVKNNHVSFTTSRGLTEYDHEDLAAIEAAVRPALSQQGLSYRWRTSAEAGQPVKVTCIVTHTAGHFEETALESSRDDSGGKNAIQAIASALTYLQRYTLRAALGLAVSRRDDDGRAAGRLTAFDDDQPVITGEQAEHISKLITEAKADIVRFLEAGNIKSVSDMPASQYAAAVVLLKKKIADNAAKASNARGTA